MPPFRHTVTVRWAELDSNGHMRNSAYLDLASHVRMTYFAAHGFPAAEVATDEGSAGRVHLHV